MPQGGGARLPPRNNKAAQGTDAPGQGLDWQRSSGGFSGAAKKEYLKWKRQQKAARTQDSSSDDGEQGVQQQQQQPQPSAASSTPAEDAAVPLQYRPLAAVPAARFAMLPAAAPAADPEPATAGADDSDVPPAVTYMPRLDPAEVGFTPQGFTLDMPTRPQWQGVVHSAEELHALEETEFAAWQAALATKAQQLAAAAPAGSTLTPHSGVTTQAAAQHQQHSHQQHGTFAGQQHQQQQHQHQQQQQAEGHVQLQQGLATGPSGLISCYEGRLEYWRQLWRTLEMSDVICMIVDARNPLLHFSHALYRHITADHQLPLVLLLNKCDLLPAAAAAAWQQWLQQQLPGVSVIPVSAAKEQAAATAQAVLAAVLQQQVLRGGQRVQVQELLGLSLDELIQESVRRNTHAKRHLEQQQQSARPGAEQQQKQQQEEDTDGEATAASSAEDEDADWSTHPNRGSRKAGRRAGRRKAPQQQQQQQQTGSGAGVEPVSAPEELEQHDPAAEQRVVDDALEHLTLERRLSSATASSSNRTPATPAAAAAAAAAAAGADAVAAAAGPVRSVAPAIQPVVVGMLGEPNVGKSSTLNALLGSHRVAVSSHPGRTKHYQTHYMCDSLVLVDCPGVVFPRLHVSPAMQVLLGSSPIASCRQPYAVVRYLAEASWPRLQDRLNLCPHLSTVQEQQQQPSLMAGSAHTSLPDEQQQPVQPNVQVVSLQAPHSSSSSADSRLAAAVLQGGTDSSGWSPWTLCEALAVKRHWVLPRSGRLDTYRAANWLLRAALAGQNGVGLAFLPPVQSEPDAAAAAGM